ncbi:hypothetical protein [Acidiphilium iwatense]|uniref:Uncharacterized protein n=1 Tax=Acidiphilium iwatense TaxID=768198 RepID=A0ABS9DSW3_9PROT|nr:hypothetical protein [Acidiphilium iwatense]MCF3945772.1 hypothetical protein [Acidiphilium iwatense]
MSSYAEAEGRALYGAVFGAGQAAAEQPLDQLYVYGGVQAESTVGAGVSEGMGVYYSPGGKVVGSYVSFGPTAGLAAGVSQVYGINIGNLAGAGTSVTFAGGEASVSLNFDKSGSFEGVSGGPSEKIGFSVAKTQTSILP